MAASNREIDHEQILEEMLEQFKPVFDASPMGVYLYLDEVHKICNQHMAEMFGMTVEEWNHAQSFLNDFVDPRDQELVARNYQHHIAQLTHPVTFQFRGRRKDGSTFQAETDMIPISWRGNPVAYHFVREVGS